MVLIFSRKIRIRILRFVLLFAILAVGKPQSISATELVDPEKAVSLTIDYRYNQSPVNGATFRIYKVANGFGSATVPTDQFAKYPVSYENLDSSGWDALAYTLAGYISRDGVAQWDSGTTNREGLLSFPLQGMEMDEGLYLVIGDHLTEGSDTYISKPFLVQLPNRNSEGAWGKNVTVEPKIEIIHKSTGEINRTVLKVWNDSGDKENRPSEISVQLLHDGKVFDTVILNKQNNWRYKWTKLEENQHWQVVEKNFAKGYTVSVEEKGTTFVITNTSHQEKTNNPTESTPGDQKSNKPEKLPLTGVLWWPVPIMAVGGMAVFLIGWFKHKNGEKDEG